jgi:general secretion pathway protein B
MSFILDALRKSENERQRSAVPRVTRAPLARPRAHPPVWTIIVIALLTCSVVVLGAAWWITISSQPGTVPAATAQTTAPTDATAATASPVAATAGDVADSVTGAAVPAPATSPAPPRTAPLDSLASTPVPVTAPAVAASPSSSQTVAVDRGGAEAGASTSARAPTRAELVADGLSIPDVRLELHAYDASGSRRFAFINGQRVVEGDTLREGPRVVSIDADSVTLIYGGSRFRITPQ